MSEPNNNSCKMIKDGSTSIEWFADTKDMTISYGLIKPTVPPGQPATCGGPCACEVLQLQGNYEAVNIGGYLFLIKYNRPVFADRLTYSLGLFKPENVQLDCDGSVVRLNSVKGGDETGEEKLKDEEVKNEVILRMDSDSKETNKITYCKPPTGELMWINFNFPQDTVNEQNIKNSAD